MKEVNNNPEDIKKIFEPIQDDPNFDELMKNFRLTCPGKKINLKLEEPNCIAGMYCLSSNEIDLKSIADISDINDDTLLFFTNQHIVELSKILYGMLLLIAENKGILKEDIYPIISAYINQCKDVHTYFNYKKFCESITSRYFNLTNSSISNEVISKFVDILIIIIFVPYNELDNIAKAAIKEFKENMKNSNE